MFSSISRRVRRVGAVALAGALMFGFGASSASAAPLINPNALGSITIHKHLQPDASSNPVRNNGLPQTVTTPPVPDVTFRIQAIPGLDLSTNAGWVAASEMTVAQAQAATAAVAGTSLETDDNGVVVFPGLAVGAYLVTETAVPSGVTPGAPFIMTVPITHPTDLNTWLYDVHVYPKNAKSGVTKTVTDAPAIKLGDTVQFTILADIPDVALIDGYKIVDDLNEKVDYVSAAVTLTNGVALIPTTDYSVTPTGAQADGPEVVVLFTEDGREKLALNSAAQVQVVLNTTINAVGEIPNTALLYPNDSSFDILPGDPGGPPETPEVITKWGNVTIHKVDSETGANLAGAVFRVYTSAADAAAVNTNYVTINGVFEFTTLANGQVDISGLRYSGWANNAAVAPGAAGYNQYYLVEVKAPAGYELLAAPILFTVDATTTTVGIDHVVKNVPHNAGFELPLTGGVGTAVFTTAGVLLLAGAGLLMVRSRRRA